MAAIILMIVATVGIMTFFVKTGKAGKTSAAEIVLSRAWSNRFSRMDLEDKRLAYLKEYEKYRRDKEKKARKKVREWDRQIENYRNQEEKSELADRSETCSPTCSRPQIGVLFGGIFLCSFWLTSIVNPYPDIMLK